MTTLISGTTNIDYLITALRLHLNDETEPYTFTDTVLRTRLVYAVKALMPRWNNKYLINEDTNYVERNPHVTYLFADPPLVQHQDERPIVLQASIDVKNSLIYTSSWNIGSWKDDEVSYSNIEGSKSVNESLNRDIEELKALLPDARKRLAQPSKQSLPGFDYPPNEYEG